MKRLLMIGFALAASVMAQSVRIEGDGFVAQTLEFSPTVVQQFAPLPGQRIVMASISTSRQDAAAFRLRVRLQDGSTVEAFSQPVGNGVWQHAAAVVLKADQVVASYAVEVLTVVATAEKGL